jgi:hypothetical protein
MVGPEDIRVLKGDRKLAKDDELKCSLCDYPYTNWDIMLSIAGGKVKNEKH